MQALLWLSGVTQPWKNWIKWALNFKLLGMIMLYNVKDRFIT